ncbi:MAG: OmpA family protein [Magnetovibrio sp.]|nr:OmpA family protein [Magnetovibrio sp.]
MAMPKKKCDSGAPTWIVTFADLMSQLLTFFVLLLSFSVIETDKFKKIAGAMSDAFGLQSMDRKAGIIELDGSPAATANKHVVPIPIPQMDVTDHVVPDDLAHDEGDQDPRVAVADLAAQQAKQTFNELQTVMAQEIASGVMSIMHAGNVTVVRFPDKVLFPSGSGEFKQDFLPILTKFLSVLENSHGNILISGHTDDIPISTDQYRSNWDLSASRASSVAHYILKYTSIAPGRITVQGFADSRPLVVNTDPQSRSKNRRVEITIKSIADGASD